MARRRDITRMLRLTDVRLPLEHPQSALTDAVSRVLSVPPDLLEVSVVRRAVDARRSGLVVSYTVDVAVPDEPRTLADCRRAMPAPPAYRHVTRAPVGAPRPVVVGAGPCGLLAALCLAQMGFRPLVLERGQAVRHRTRDTWALWRRGVLDPESNVQFGEGGAGTFSDGKLWSQVRDPARRGRKVLEEFVRAGAPEEILTEAHPHIGTFRLVTMVESIRAEIESLGGAYRFATRVTGLELGPRRQLRGVRLADGTVLPASHAVLAPGHSARDLFAALYSDGVAMAAKPFSLGVRIEHPQAMIDRARWGRHAGHPALGSAEYRLVHHHAGTGRSVYSFCMCPGGTVVAAASEAGRQVTNGMSQHSRAERNANAGIVVGITPADYPGGPLAGIALQRHWEERAFVAGGNTYAAPVQTVGDFLVGRASTTLSDIVPSYRPGVTPTDLATCLPDFAVAAIRAALPAFARDIPGFDRPDAVMTGVETRTSSPLRLDRDDATLESVNTPGLYPAGEGAGYAGGILSAGIDGIRVAEAVALSIMAGATAAQAV